MSEATSLGFAVLAHQAGLVYMARFALAVPTTLMTLVALGCGPASRGDPEFWAPRIGGGGAEPGPDQATSAEAAGPGAGGGGGGGNPTVDQSYSFRFNTASFDGEYAPKNVGAVWITDSQDLFVKTLELWAAKRAKHLVKWRAASGNNVADAVTGATRSSHGPHESFWDGTNAAGEPVPDGAYRIYAELTEENSASASNPDGPWLSVDFVKGPDPLEMILPDQPSFTSIHLASTP